jgi:hypothetical protein
VQDQSAYLEHLVTENRKLGLHTWVELESGIVIWNAATRMNGTPAGWKVSAMDSDYAQELHPNELLQVLTCKR